MNFDTKYLIRWGIPGWTTVMLLSPYFIINNFKALMETISATDLLGYGAVLAVLGVPLGYILNQIHHFITWVFPKLITNTWDEFFEEEIKIDIYLKNEASKSERERYRYLLSRKHELGGITVSLGISFITTLFTNILQNKEVVWVWIYCLITFILFLIFLVNRDYSSKNIDKYHNYFLHESKRHTKNKILL